MITAGVFFIEPHGMLSSFLEHPYYTGFNVQGKAGDDWRTKVWIECPNGKSSKAYKFFTKEEVANKKHKQRVLELMEYGANAYKKEILDALREKDPRDWIGTILEFGKSSKENPKGRNNNEGRRRPV